VIRHRGAKDAAAARAEQLREDRERLLEERESSALRQIVEATHLLPPISWASDPSDETVESVREFTRRVAYTCLQLRDEELRFRLMIGVDALDLAKPYPMAVSIGRG
jgi:hypothetical protein